MEQKYYYDATKGYSFDSYVKFFRSLRQKGNAKFVYTLREEDLLKGDIMSQIENINIIIKKLKKSGIDKNEIVISFLHDKSYKTNSNESCKVLYELEQHFSGYKIGIESGDVTWSSEQIVNANKKLDKIVEDIKSKNLSKLEQLFLSYSIITQKIYKEASNNESLYTSREVYGILNSDKIVCVGYVELLKEIMARLGIENDIKIFSNKVKLPGKTKTEYHENCIIYIKDDKYGLDGYYYCDPTWDSKREGDTNIRLAYFMLPLRDVKNISSIIQTYPVRYEEIEHLTATYNKISSYHRPQYADEISLGQTGLVMTEKLSNFLENDKKLRAMIGQNNIYSNMSIDGIYGKDPKFVYSLLRQRSKEYKISTMLELLKNVLKKTNPEETDEAINEKVSKIYQENYNNTQKCLNRNAISCFSMYQNRMAINGESVDKNTKNILLSVLPKNNEREMWYLSFYL